MGWYSSLFPRGNDLEGIEMKTIKRQRWTDSLLMATLVVLTTTFFVACGGGGGGSGGGGGVDLLKSLAQPSFGTMGNAASLQPFNTGVATPQSLVGPTDFASANGTDVNFLLLQFSMTVSETSIMAGGITVRGSDNLERSFFLDKAGAIDPTNAFTADEAPQNLRIYFQNTLNPGVPIALPADGYRVRLSNLILKSAAGTSYCVAEQGGVCMLQSDSVFFFTLDGQNTPVAGNDAPLAAGPTPALPLPNILASDDEIRIFFDHDVDFQSIVGFNPTNGVVNVTSQDPFCSIPFQIGMGPMNGTNLLVNYTPPVPTLLPFYYGYIIYMPNPFNDASEIRIRFVDTTMLSPFDDPNALLGPLPTTQSYAIPSSIWANALLANSSLTPPMDTSPAQNGPLELPTKLPLPGTTAAGTANITVTLASPGNGIATDSSAANAVNADGITGVTDRARRQLASDIVVTRVMATGPVISANPEPPDLNIVGNGSVLDGFSTAGNTVNAVPGGMVTGILFRVENQINDNNTLMDVRDVQFGAFLNAANSLMNTPRRANNALAIALGMDPGVLFPPGAFVPEVTLNSPPLPPHAQPWGARMYVVDAVEDEVKVFNSHTFQPLGIVSGISSPRGLGVGGQFFYVSNFAQDTITRFGGVPGTGLFHKVVSTTSVGAGPTVVTVQPNQEDVACINTLDNSMSWVDLPSFTERAQFPVGMGASELAVSSRWTGQGTTFAFQAYVPNTLSNTVTIFESDSPLPSVPNGPNGKVIEDRGGFAGPVNGTWTFTLGAFQGIGAQGMYVPNSLGNSVTYMGMTSFNLAPQLGFPGPPPTRIFNTILDYTGTGLSGGPTDAAVDPTSLILAQAVVSLQAIYPGSGQVVVHGAADGVIMGTVTIPGNTLFTAADQ